MPILHFSYLFWKFLCNKIFVTQEFVGIWINKIFFKNIVYVYTRQWNNITLETSKQEVFLMAAISWHKSSKHIGYRPIYHYFLCSRLPLMVLNITKAWHSFKNGQTTLSNSTPFRNGPSVFSDKAMLFLLCSRRHFSSLLSGTDWFLKWKLRMSVQRTIVDAYIGTILTQFSFQSFVI